MRILLLDKVFAFGVLYNRSLVFPTRTPAGQAPGR